ncbi:MAG: aspartate carbamoyltransferase [Patescibacteria group bacterium]
MNQEPLNFSYTDALQLHHIIQTQQFDLDTIFHYIFPLADHMKMIVETGGANYLAGKNAIVWFEQPSTRTHVSFIAAFKFMGGKIMFSTENAAQFSSKFKGESTADTFKILSGYNPDIIISRFIKAGDALTVALSSAVPIINAGDGDNQHPTQALLDLYTIYKKFGRVNHTNIALVGDLLHGRTIRSLAYLFGKFSDIRLSLVSTPALRINKDIKDYLTKHSIDWSEHTDLLRIASQMDVLYMTRIQAEQGSSIEEKDKEPGRFSIDAEVLRLLPQQSIIMHPLPRLWEIPEYVDNDPRAHYFIQAQNGLYIRMALLLMVLRPDLVPQIIKN